MAWSKRQSATNSGFPVTVTLASTPIPGSLLIIMAGDRGGATGQSISGTGWTKQEEIAHKPSDGTHRHLSAFYWKIAGASEPTAVTLTSSGGGGTVAASFIEYETNSGDILNFEDSVSNVTDQADAPPCTSVSTGTTASILTSNNFMVAMCSVKEDGSTPWTTWTNSFINDNTYDPGGLMDQTVAILADASTGTKETTASGTQTNRGSIAALFVFSIAPTGTPVAQAIETETAQPIHAALTRQINTAVESDEALRVLWNPHVPIRGRWPNNSRLSKRSPGQFVMPGVNTNFEGQASAANAAAELQREWFFGPAATAGQTATPSQAVETDTAFALLRSKVKALSQAVETSVAQAITRLRRIAVGHPSEVDTAQPLAHTKARTPAQATEADSATALIKKKAKTLGLASAADTAGALAEGKARIPGMASEADTATTLAKAKRRTLGQPSTADTSQAILRKKTRLLGQPNEAASAQPITPTVPSGVVQAAESNTAQPIVRTKHRAAGQSAETSVAQPLKVVKSRTLGASVETDIAQAIAKLKKKVLGQVVESEIGQALTHPKRRTLGLPSEVTAAMPVGHTKVRIIGIAVETSNALGITHSAAVQLGMATEVGTALGLDASKVRLLGQVTETSFAFEILVTGGAHVVALIIVVQLLPLAGAQLQPPSEVALLPVPGANLTPSSMKVEL